MTAATQEYKLISSTKGFSLEAVKAALSQTDLNENIIRGVLAQQGLKDELLETATKEVMAAASAKKLGEAEGVATVFTKGLKNALRGLGTTLKSVFVFLATNPIGWIIDGVAAVIAFTKLYSKFTTSANEANAAVSESLETSQNNVKTVREQKDNVDKLTESYEKLSKGVNTATNENLTLSTDDYKEYLDTCNQIADMYPELISGYDAQGNAILSLKGNVQGLTDAYKEAQQEAYKTAFVGVTDDKGKTTGGIKSIEDQFKLATNKADPGKNWWNAESLSTNGYIDTYKEMINMSDKQLKDLRPESLKNGTWGVYKAALKKMDIKWSDISKASEEELAKYRAQMEQQVQSFVQTQEDAVSNAKSSIEGYMKGVTDASGNALASGYDKLTEKQQNLATSLLSSINLNTLQEFENSGDFAKAEQKWVDNLVSSVSNMSATAKNAYDKLQDSIANPDDLTSAGIENIDKYLDTLGSELNISKDKLKEIFNLDDIFDTQTSFDNLVKQYLGEDTFNELSSGAKKAANSVDEYGNSVKEAGKSSAELFASQQAQPVRKPSILYLRNVGKSQELLKMGAGETVINSV